jgi:hypothetical protein
MRKDAQARFEVGRDAIRVPRRPPDVDQHAGDADGMGDSAAHRRAAHAAGGGAGAGQASQRVRGSAHSRKNDRSQNADDHQHEHPFDNSFFCGGRWLFTWPFRRHNRDHTQGEQPDPARQKPIHPSRMVPNPSGRVHDQRMRRQCANEHREARKHECAGNFVQGRFHGEKPNPKTADGKTRCRVRPKFTSPPATRRRGRNTPARR